MTWRPSIPAETFPWWIRTARSWARLMAGGASTRPGAAIDGNDNVWVADAFGRTITHLCGVRLENCPPGAKTGDPISPPGGYLGGVQITTDVAIDPAGNVWVANNWDRPDEGFKKEPDSAYSTRFGGNGTVVFYGLAKPVKTPLIGPPQAPQLIPSTWAPASFWTS
jgi:hypothetical protein